MNPWESHLRRWTDASLIDPVTADRIRAYEAQQQRAGGLRWPTLIALAFGALLLGAGVLLFVSAHWDNISPAARMTLVVAMVAGFHIAGAYVSLPLASQSLHTVGTIALGAGIALTGQIFHLEVHWPSGVMLWAIGAAVAFAILRHPAQAAIAAVLIPYWLAGEWSVAMQNIGVRNTGPIVVGLFLTAVTYFTSGRPALTWIGGLALIPLSAWLWTEHNFTQPDWTWQFAGWSWAIAFPLGLALWLRARGILYYVGAAAFALAIYFINDRYGRDPILNYPLFALFSIALVAWGVREQAASRINIGIAGFALTVLAFYFSSISDKLGRSAGLIALGILFLAGGWFLERTRRRLVSSITP